MLESASIRKEGSSFPTRSMARTLFFAVALSCLAGGLLSAGAQEPRAGAAPADAAATSSGAGPGHQAEAAAAEEHGLPRNAVEIARLFGFPITNSMVVTWIVAAGPDRLRPGRHAAT